MSVLLRKSRGIAGIAALLFSSFAGASPVSAPATTTPKAKGPIRLESAIESDVPPETQPENQAEDRRKAVRRPLALNRELVERQAPLELLAIRREPASRVLNVPKPYPSMQKAIDAAAPGDVVMVGPGDYVGDVRLKDGITLAAERPNAASLDGVLHLANDTRVINLTFIDSRVGHSSATVESLDEWKLPAEAESVVETASGTTTETPKPSLRNVQFLMCRFQGKKTTRSSALLYLENVSEVAVHGCVFTQADVSSHGKLFGAFFRNCGNVRFQGNTVSKLRESDWGDAVGCYFELCSGVISNNLIFNIHEDDWGSSFGMLIVTPRRLIVLNNTIFDLTSSDWDSTFGISIRGAGESTVKRNLVDGIQGAGWTAPVFGIHSDTTDPVIVENNVSRLTPDSKKEEMYRPYVGTGGAIDYRQTPHFITGTYCVAGPRPLVGRNGANRVGLYAGRLIPISLPAGVHFARD